MCKSDQKLSASLTVLIASLQGDSGTDGRVSDLMDGGRMALDNKTSLLNTPLLSSSPRGAREHFLDSPFKHSRKDTSMDDSEHLTDGAQTDSLVCITHHIHSNQIIW